MKKITISISALFLALGVLSGCGQKEEAPKAEAPEQKPAEQAAQPAAEPAAEPAAAVAAPAVEADPVASNPMTAMTDAAKAAGDAVTQAADATTQAVGDAAQAVGDTATKAADATTQAVGDAAQAVGDTATQAAAGAVAAVVAFDGEKIYKGLCFSCHDMGIAGAPKLGDKAAWAPRIATGMDAMYTTTINGKGAMPAKGGNPALSDDEIKASVDWMVAQSK